MSDPPSPPYPTFPPKVFVVLQCHAESFVEDRRLLPAWLKACFRFCRSRNHHTNNSNDDTNYRSIRSPFANSPIKGYHMKQSLLLCFRIPPDHFYNRMIQGFLSRRSPPQCRSIGACTKPSPYLTMARTAVHGPVPNLSFVKRTMHLYPWVHNSAQGDSICTDLLTQS